MTHAAVQMHPSPATPRSIGAIERGLALPVVLVMLIVLAFAGLLAARRSATVQDISNNHRMGQVALLAAQTALRYCESVVIDTVEGSGHHKAAVRTRVVETPMLATADEDGAVWKTLANWAPGADQLIDVPRQAEDASAALMNAATPTCMAQAMTGGRYLVTARGLSASARVDDNGRLAGNAGSEVWLQAILSPDTPVRSNTGAGYE